MFLTLTDCELWTTVYLFRRADVGLLDNSILSFPDLIQPLFWAVLKLSVSLPAPLLQRKSLLTPHLHISLRWQSFATWPSQPQLKHL